MSFRVDPSVSRRGTCDRRICTRPLARRTRGSYGFCVKRIFKQAIKRDGALVCGLNLPFDLSRLALDWKKGADNEWSLIMARYPDGTENRNYPRVLITPIDSKKAFVKLAPPWHPEEWKSDSNTHFLDLRTLGLALFNKSFSLKRVNELNTEHKKLEEHEPTGKVTYAQIALKRPWLAA